MRYETDDVAIQPIARNKWLSGLLAAASIVTAVAAPQLIGVLLYGIVGGLAGFLSLQYGQPSAPGMRNMHPGTIEADDAWLAVTIGAPHGRTRKWPRAHVVQGWVDSHGGFHQAVFRLKNGDHVWVRCASAREARKLLGDVGLAPDQQVFSAPLRSTAARVPGLFALSIAGLLVGVPMLLLGAVAIAGSAGGPLGIAIGVGLAFTALAASFGLLRVVVRRRATVGTDGVLIEGVGTTRFVPYADVASIECDAQGVWLHRKDGRDELLATGTSSRGIVRPSANTVALYERVREAQAVGLVSTVGEAKLDQLDRKGRGLADWLRDVAALPSEQAGYRRMSIDRDDLLQVMLDATATPERRIAAAAALSATGDPEARQRVRIAADSCAHERLRIALGAAADGELDEETVELATRKAELG